MNNIDKLKRMIVEAVKRMRMHKKDKAQMKLSEFFHSSPLADIDLSRDKSLLRNIEKSHR